MIVRGSVWWVDLGEPRGSEPGPIRPAVVISADTYNRSATSTIVVVVITSNLRLGAASGNVVLAMGVVGLPKASVVNVTQIATVDRYDLIEPLGQFDDELMGAISLGLRRSLTSKARLGRALVSLHRKHAE